MKQRRATALHSGNAEFIDSLYEQFMRSPDTVDAHWRSVFEDLTPGAEQAAPGGDGSAWRRSGPKPYPTPVSKPGSKNKSRSYNSLTLTGFEATGKPISTPCAKSSVRSSRSSIPPFMG